METEPHRKRVRTYHVPGPLHFLTFSCYCRQNPVSRKLVSSPEQWRWSSFRWLELGQKVDEPLALDDWDERLSEDEDKRPLAEYGLSQWHQFCEGTSRP